MRIIAANNYYYLRGGSERVMFDEERSLRARGHEVIPYSAWHANNYPAESSEYFAPQRGADSSSILHKITSIRAFVNNTRAGSSFAALLDAKHPEVIHCHNIYGSLTTSILVEATKREIPAVMTAHDAKLICPTYLCLDHGKICEACHGKNYYQAILKNCHAKGIVASSMFALESYYNSFLKRYETLSRIITPSRFLKELFIRNGVDEGRLEFIPNGVDVDDLEPQIEPGNYALYVGRLSAEKGVLTLLKAITGSGIPLRLVGEGPVRAEAEALAAGSAMIRFEGYKQGSELSELYRKAAFVVVPSEWYENAPMSVLESFAHGKPVLGARIGGIPELVRPGETGELFEPKNVEELRHSLMELFQNREDLKRRGQRARHLVEQEYSLKLHTDRIIGLYEHLV